MKRATKLSVVFAALMLLVSTIGFEPADAARRKPGVEAQRQRANAAAKAARVRKARQDRVVKHLKARPQREAEQRKASAIARDGMRALHGREAAQRSGRSARVRTAGPVTNVTITPTTNLAPGQSVQITGSGLTAGSYFFAVECANDGGQGVIDCDLANYRPVITAPDGTVDFQMRVNRRIRLSDGSVYDCGQAPNVCNISWVDLGNAVETAAVPISFDPNAAPAITLSVSPSTNLVHLQTVTFSGTATAFTELDLVQCPTGADPSTCANTARGYAFVGSNGKYTDTMNVRRIIGRPGNTVDCATPNACELVASEYFSLDLVARVPLSFNPNGPVPPPVVVTASPSTGLLHGQDVSVTGSGFDPFDYGSVTQCSLDTQGQLDACRSSNSFVSIDAAGAFTTTISVTRRLWSYSGVFVDCAEIQCVIIADSGFGTTARANISFDGTVAPPPPPAASVTPSTGLVHAAPVTVEGVNFDRNADIEIEQCSEIAFVCRRQTQRTTSGADGSFSASVPLSRTLTDPFAGNQVDCADIANACYVNVWDSSSGYTVKTPILFAAGPLPVPPRARFDTKKALHDGRPVNIVGEGWFPGDEVSVRECALDLEGYPIGCISQDVDSVTVPTDGTFTTAFTPHRKVPTYGCVDGCDLKNAKPASHDVVLIDCLDEGVRCVATVQNYTDGSYVNVPMRFDRGAPLAPPPTLEVTPSTKLRDRQTITVTGKGFDAGAWVELGICQADSREYCGSYTSATADANGAISTPLTVRRSLGNGATGPRKCDVDGVRCTIVVLYTSSYLQSPVSVPIAFDRGSPIHQPTVTVTPTVGLVDGQTVHVTGSNFSPDSQVIFGQCTAFDNPVGGCSEPVFTMSDASGNIDATFNVASVLVVQDGNPNVDCSASPGACVIAVVDRSAGDFVVVPLTFGTVVTPTTRASN